MEKYFQKTTDSKKDEFDEAGPSSSLFPYDSYLFGEDKYFIVIKREGDKLSAKCNSCFKILNGSTASTGNFLAHISVRRFYTIIK